MTPDPKTLTPAELNRAIAELRGWTEVHNHNGELWGWSPGMSSIHMKVIDWAGDIGAAMGLVENATVTINAERGSWIVVWWTAQGDDFFATGQNPARAIAEAYYLAAMKGGGK